MAEKRKQTDFLQKAAMYESLAQYYKYSNPNLHIHYYLKHLKNMNKALNIMYHRSYSNKTGFAGEAKIRILLASSDLQKIVVEANHKQITKDLAFKNISDYVSLPSGNINITVFSSESKSQMVLNKEIQLISEKSYTLAIVGNKEKSELLTIENLPEVPFNETKIRCIHLSNQSPSLDLAVKDRDIVFPNIKYQQATEYLGLTPMTIDLELRKAGSNEIVLPMPKLHFQANTAYSLILVDRENILIIKD